MSDQPILRLAIQKKGRLHDDSYRLLKECGIKVRNGGGRLRGVSSNFPLEVYFLRDDDIPQYVEDGVADIGIVGENVIFEKKKKVSIEEPLGFGKCRLSLALPKSRNYNSVKDLQGARIATSYPNILKEFLQKNQVEADIHEISGSVEIAPGIGLADYICDLVSTGSTLLSNGLKEVETILRSEAVLIATQNLDLPQRQLLNKLLFRIRAVQRSRNNKYILLNAPNDKVEAISNILPGMKSPTVMPLADEGWSSVHSVVQEDKFWDIIEDLRANGAQGILVVPIEKMII
ncbi:MAG: ATP phosphoribosyltransferase [Bacteroidota bacterium]